MFVERLEDTAPLVLLEAAASLTLIFEVLALVAAVLLWQPWTRLTCTARHCASRGGAGRRAVIVVGVWEPRDQRVQDPGLPTAASVGDRGRVLRKSIRGWCRRAGTPSRMRSGALSWAAVRRRHGDFRGALHLVQQGTAARRGRRQRRADHRAAPIFNNWFER
ncbi:MAG: hypothetical protein IPK17_14060 [Chloroflexi bacterium]|uniref:hypothetical protein n=1 Tax=Candidatus Flexifilum breve TaxID=3140694 RepID=UPI0031368688|nr:hypothetical protein [Chloroflexota bacterium]